MKILLDVNTPAPLTRSLRGHDVSCADKIGWEALSNGELLTAAEQAGFELLITCDQNLPYQQNLVGRRISLIILSRNNWPRVRKATARIASAVDFVQRGQVLRIEIE